MSAMSSLVLFLLYFSLHACHARFSTGAVHKDATKESQCLTSKRNATLNNLTRVSSDLESSSQNKANIRSDEAVKHVDHQAKDDRKVGVLGTTETDSRGSVSWRLHHKKRGDDEDDGQEAEFNLDYLPPRTHPPAHN